MSYAFLCEVCNASAVWRLDRRGDAAVTWTCEEDLSDVLWKMQRNWEVTEVVVRKATIPSFTVVDQNAN